MKEITLTNGMKTKVDDDDFEKHGWRTWYACGRRRTGQYHAMTTIKKKTVFLHRLILGITDPSIIVDHIDNNGLNNCKCNLRQGNKLTNAYHRPRRGDSTLKYKGIARSGKNRFCAFIKSKGKSIYLGSFPTQEEAAYAYNAAARKYHGEYAFLNEIQTFEQYQGA